MTQGLGCCKPSPGVQGANLLGGSNNLIRRDLFCFSFFFTFSPGKLFFLAAKTRIASNKTVNIILQKSFFEVFKASNCRIFSSQRHYNPYSHSFTCWFSKTSGSSSNCGQSYALEVVYLSRLNWLLFFILVGVVLAATPF